jgi:glycosyltransferase involved in cell wall biosynthesis
MNPSQGPGTTSRPRLLAVATIPPLPIINGFTLRVANILRELGTYWSITLVAPELPPGSAHPASIPGVERLVTVPMVGRMKYLPSQYDVGPLRQRVNELLTEQRPDAMLLWGGTEFLAFDRNDLPHTVADRIDCATLTAWRQAKVAPTLRHKLSELSEVLTYGSYERRIDRSADHVVVVGEADAGVMRRIGGRRNVHVISNGVDLPAPGATFGPQSADPTITFTGVLSYPPNVDAVRFFADGVLPLVRREEPRAVFLVAGRTPSAEIRALAERPGVRLQADVEDMRTVIASSWMAVAPMQSGSGVKNKILEAWALGKPVIMTSLAANGLDLDHQVTSLVADRPAELAKLVVGLIRDPASRQRLGGAGQELVTRHHSWSGVGKQMDALLRGPARTG